VKSPVYILIPAHNRKEITLQCLTTLRDLGALKQYSVVLVDDGSTDGTEVAVRQNFPAVHLLGGDGDLWWTGAIAMAMQYAYSRGAQYLIWLNDDCQISLAVLSGLISFCEQHPKSIVGCQGYISNGSNQIAFGGKAKTWKGYRWLPIPQGTVSQCDLLSGNIVCMPRSVIDEIGYPDTHNTPHYGGDSLYLIRAQKAGFQLWIDARHAVYDVAINHNNQLYPDQWLLAEGSAWRLLELASTPQSGLSWRIWMAINWEAYGIWGLVMFLKKYLSILIITALRLLPHSIRKAMCQKISTSQI
jgi:GT2 family glycosyltransferase